MTTSRLSRSAAAVISCGLLAAWGCSAPGGPGSETPWPPGSTGTSGGQTTDGGAGGDLPSPRPAGLCTPPRTSEPLPPRVDLMGSSPMAVTATHVVHTSEVFARFNSLCGACHVVTAMGTPPRQTSEATFATTVDAAWLGAITSEDPAKAMPPENKAYSSRPAGDPVRQLVAYLQAWMAAGRPADLFAVDDAPVGPSGGASSLGYSFTTDMAQGMSNLGTCIPDKASYATSGSNEMASKDAMFAAATELPGSLSETDLVTFDASALAANGVVAFVPTYPLWSDGSGKLRHVRVPKGASIKFDKATQTFDIPPNTRFYKTFLRKVKDAAGNESYRKIETRLIVARPDRIGADGTTVEQTALFGTYLWTDDETAAFLHELPYRDGTPFTDRTLTYVTDEVLYYEALQAVPAGSSQVFADRLARELEDRTKYPPGVIQHYAVPGRIRCRQCHMGSPSKNFVLGFFPLQVARQPDGQAGTYERTGADELTQLQRMLDYGLITGMDSPADVVGLEQSQAPRHARTHEELAAQAYMVGNCAHCHNPRGYPSTLKPELSSALSFMPGPGPDGGGVFEFPLTRMSPVRLRGTNRDIPIPYITPSLRDYPVVNEEMVRLDSGAQIEPGADPTKEKTWSPKYAVEAENSGLQTIAGMKVARNDPRGCARADANVDFCGARRTGHTFVAAPWRSLIYRNVDTPFPYYDDYVPFPHMPMNTAGYDARAARLMGDWMVSLPAVRADPKSTELGHGEDDLPATGAKAHDGSYDDSPQPYVEVMPGDPRYAEAVAAARVRLAEYRAGIRYNYREEVLGADILDEIRLPTGDRPDPREYRPDPTRYLYSGIPPHDPGTGAYVFPAIGVPYHSHWFDYDPTDNSDNWQPRRGTAWKGVLVDGVADRAPPAGGRKFDPDDPLDGEMQKRVKVTAALKNAELTDALRTYATTPVPYGLWKVKPECEAKLASMPKVSDVSGTPDAPWWISHRDPSDASAPPAATAPVYMVAPGQALYRHICFNCHGPKADGRGIQGDALAAASDGEARPANFVAGLFGPVDHPGDNLLRVFGSVGQPTGELAQVKAAAQLASRYMAWMALGGTLQNIPRDIIHQIEATRVLGEQRPNLQSLAGTDTEPSANMLNLAKSLCWQVLPATIPGNADHFGANGSQPLNGYPMFSGKKASFVWSNGDREMWVRLCSQFNRPVVRVYSIVREGANENPLWVAGLDEFAVPGFPSSPPLKYADGYPADAPVWDQDQLVQRGVDPTKNFYPACLSRPDSSNVDDLKVLPAMIAAADTFQAARKMPTCPAEWLLKGKALSPDDAEAWTLNGAIATGMAVFSYLRDPATDLSHKPPAPYYDECQLLP